MPWCNPGSRSLGSPVAAFVVRTTKRNVGMEALIIHRCGTLVYQPSGGSDGFVERRETEFRSWGFSQVSVQHPQVISAWASLRPFDLRKLPHIYSGEAAPLVQALRASLSLPRIDTMEDRARRGRCTGASSSYRAPVRVKCIPSSNSIQSAEVPTATSP